VVVSSVLRVDKMYYNLYMEFPYRVQREA